ncbi:MAG: glycosidase [Actinomycetota bacterium]
MQTPFRRHESSPVLRPQDLPDESALVFNAGVVEFDGQYLMAYRSDRGTAGNPFITGTDIGFATSADGVVWKPEPTVRFDRSASIELLQPLEPHRDLEQELWRIYDPRLTVVDRHGIETLLMSFAADTTHGLRAGLAESIDGERWQAIALSTPDNRNQVLFPELVDDHWLRLERPMNTYGGDAMGAERFGVWLSRSPDLIHWGQSRFLVDEASFPFSDGKVGPGAPPVRTAEGWLCFVHAVASHPTGGKRGWEDSWGRIYRVGAILLDLDDPSKVLAAAPVPVLEPEVDYETDGFRNDVIFPTGAVARPGDNGDEVWLYYGAADTVVGLATARVDDVVEFVRVSAAAG